MSKVLVLVGETCKDRPCEELSLYYLKLCSRFLPVARVCYGAGSGAREPWMARERTGIEKRLQTCGRAVLLDESGATYSTLELLKKFEGWIAAGRGPLAFVLGGPYGLHRDLFVPGRERLSLSKLTLPHELALVVLLEQLYRVLAIRSGKRYHY